MATPARHLPLSHPRARNLNAYARLKTWRGFLSKHYLITVGLYITIVFNAPLWQTVIENLGGTQGNVMFLVSLFIAVLLISLILQALINYSVIYKPVMSIIFVVSSVALYFSSQYGTVFDRTMIQNVFETDSSETYDLLTTSLFFHVLLFGILPATVLWLSKIPSRKFAPQLLRNCLIFLFCTITLGGIIFSQFGAYSSFFRTHHEVRYLISPANYIYAVSTTVLRDVENSNKVVTPIGLDANIAITWQQRGMKNLTIVVVGETARAANFSIYGYKKDTNPRISSENIIAFNDVSSCGTATATSLPCMFALEGREDFDRNDAKSQESVVDVLKHAGISAFWLDNNSGCKGVCDRIPHEDLRDAKVSGVCNEQECFDEVLLHDLDKKINALTGDVVVFLHQKGSHGPAYSKRYPPNFEKFSPVCESAQLAKCSQEQVVNSYDNTIAYTDHFLGEVIKQLKSYDKEFNTAMLYVSDHGESLGENKLYLHGLPYNIAPKYQKHIPMVLWLSDNFSAQNHIDANCLRDLESSQLSHDNLFHSLLGMNTVDTTVYIPKLDIFSACQT